VHRRNLLKSAAAIGLLPAFGSPAAAIAALPPRRVRPTDPAWPSPADWERLKAEVGGALVKPVPLMAQCDLGPASAACQSVKKNLFNPFYIGDQPAGTEVSGWLDAWSPQPSVWAIAARSTADVVAAVNFARHHNLRVAVKGGGHSYQGTSNAADSLLIWTRAMHAVTLHDGFVGQGCAGIPPIPTVTIEAGAMWIDAYDAVTTKAGRYVQGGGCTSVGVAGLLHGGGFGSFSKGFGTAAASLIEAEVVTADGVARAVNARLHPDLYWAIKGGGGGSFGVLTRVTLRTHALPEWFGGAGAVIKAASDAAFRKLLARFTDFYASSLFNSHWGEQVSVRPDNSLKISMACQGLANDETNATWRPFLDWLAASPGDFTFKEAFDGGARPSRGYWDAQARKARGSTAMILDPRPGAPPTHAWWEGDQEQVGVLLHGYDSLWLPEGLLDEARRPALADALFAASRHWGVDLHFNKGLAGAPAEAIAASRDTATNPAVLTAFALAIIATGGPQSWAGQPTSPGYLAFARANAAAIDRATRALRAVAPEAGSYVSESNYFNPSWREAFWGSHYPKLRAVKARYDSGGLFIVHHGVGSEDWSPDGFSRVVGI